VSYFRGKTVAQKLNGHCVRERIKVIFNEFFWIPFFIFTFPHFSIESPNKSIQNQRQKSLKTHANDPNLPLQVRRVNAQSEKSPLKIT
jgi:hypothetical protein